MKPVFVLLIGICALFASIVHPQLCFGQPPKLPEAWPEGGKEWPKPDWLDLTSKRLDKAKEVRPQGQEIESLLAKAESLREEARRSQENAFRFERLIAAINSLLDAADRIAWARKTDREPQDKDFWGAGFVLQGCYFRVRQADYFADLARDKNGKELVKFARSLYQQGRGAYDAREYHRARLLGDSSSLIVFALECIAQATIPDPHIYH